MAKSNENQSDCVSQTPKAKSKMVARIVRLVRAEGLNYEDWRYVSRRVRQLCELRPDKKPVKLPRILTADEFRHFYQIVDRAEDVQHALMLRLVFYTGVRVSELCRIEIADIDLENCKIFINQGKGAKDRYVLFGKTFATALRTHIAAHPSNRCAEPCKQHLRSVLEAHFGILYILEIDSERRGLSYHVADIYRRIKIYRKADPSESIGVEFRKAVRNEPAAVEVLSSLPPISFQANIQRLTNLLQSAPYQPVDQEWQRTKAKHKGRNPAWHALFDGPKTVRELAYHLNKAFWYEIQYGEWSDVIHAGSSLHHVGIDTSDPTGASKAIRPLRHPDGLRTVLDHVAGITIELERTLAGKYLGKISQGLLHDQFMSAVRPSLELARRVSIKADWT